jgi:hypothetical protein
MKSQEPKLHECGILTEKSDIRAHVSVVNKTIYVFKTIHGVAALDGATEESLKTACQAGVKGITAKGWPVSIDAIKDLRKVDLSMVPWKTYERHKMTTSERGQLAVNVVLYALKCGLFPMWIESTESNDASIQIAGTDVVLAFNKRIQVKCDWKCGDKPLGTGNVFLQYAERNPLKAR